MFLIVSGYGFMKALLDGRKSGKTRLQRALNLYIPYWVVNVFMCIIALLAVPVAGDCGLDLGVKPLVYNVVALETSYNPYCWFVLPYVLLAVFSRPLCLFVKRNKAVAVVAVGLVCHILSYAALDSWASFLSANPLLMLVANLIYLMFPFLLGTLFAKYSWKAHSGLAMRGLADTKVCSSLYVCCFSFLQSCISPARSIHSSPSYSCSFS